MNINTFTKVFQEEWAKYKTQMETSMESLEKIRKDKPESIPTFEEDPIKYILYSYPTLKDSLEQLLTKDFLDYITGIYIIAPVPTTFKVILHNNQFFYMIYMGRTWIAKVSGKKYYLLNVGERGRATEAIARLLMMGAPAGIEPAQEAASNDKTETPFEPTGGGGGENPFAGGAETESEEGPSAEETSGAEPLAESKKKVLLEFGKKYPQAFRILTKQALILEGTFNQNTGKVVQRILGSKENQSFGFLPMSDPKRIGNPNKIEPDVFQDFLQSLYPEAEIKLIPPRVAPNPSGKFVMYQLDTEYGPAGVLLASGANKGEKYEKDFFESMKKNAGVPNDQIDNPEIKQLYEYLEIDNEDLTPDQIQNTGKSNNKRQLSFGGPEDVGQKIADITIMPDIYLSIKDPKGTGIYNGGNLKFIKQSKEDQSIYFDEQEFGNDNSVTKEIMTTIGIDPQRIAVGLNDYETKEGAPTQWEEITDYDDNLVHNLLASAYGYGYYYVRQVKPGELKIVSIESPEDAYEMVGDIKSIKIKYAGIQSKATEVRIETSSQLMGDNVYQIDIRNSGGLILPGIKIKTLK
jgi:hypothetical protein